MTTMAVNKDLLGEAVPTAAELSSVVSAVIGRPSVVAGWTAERVPYESGSPATGRLARVRGVTDDGAPWSVFVKVLQHPRHWLLLDRVPAQVRAHFLTNFPWRAELSAWEPTFAAHLPPGLRVPILYRVVELGDDRVAVWMENIESNDDAWNTGRFALAARLLGTLAANRRDPELLAACPVPPGYGLRRYYDGMVRPVLPWLHSHELWRDPRVISRGGNRLRTDLLELSGRVPGMLDRLDQLPQAMPHGDASPQNLLVPVNEPDTLVAIDVAFQCPLAIGFDLAQLLVGLVHAGQLTAADLPAVHDVLATAYHQGMTTGDRPASLPDVQSGYLGSLVVRSAFTSLPFREPPKSLADEYLEQRLDLTRFITDVGLGREPT